MNRRDILRTTLLGSAGFSISSTASPAREFPADQDASKELARSDWKPIFLDSHQNETLILLCDLILPATDTPGAKEALVNRFLDLLMSVEKAETQRAFIAALAFIDGACRERYHSVFLYTPRDEQIAFLNLLAYPHSHATWREETVDFPGYDHFQRLKKWIVGAFYSSPIGLKQLGWDGTFPHGEFTGCSHAAGGGEHSSNS